jgi:tetratricopeptide (TPR) repeat protein
MRGRRRRSLALLLLSGLGGCQIYSADECIWAMHAPEKCAMAIESVFTPPAERARAYTWRGMGNLGEGHHPDQSVQDFDQAVRLDPNTEGVFRWRCQAYLDVGKPDLAIQDCDESLRRRPERGGALDTRGKAYAATGQYERAIRDFDAAIKTDPLHREWFRDRGLAYLALGQQARADADLATFEKMLPLVGYDD